MARHGIVALLAATLLGASVNAGPCKPYSSVALSSTVIVEPTMTGSSTITADITGTTDALETTVTEATTDVTDTTDALKRPSRSQQSKLLVLWRRVSSRQLLKALRILSRLQRPRPQLTLLGL